MSDYCNVAFHYDYIHEIISNLYNNFQLECFFS